MLVSAVHKFLRSIFLCYRSYASSGRYADRWGHWIIIEYSLERQSQFPCARSYQQAKLENIINLQSVPTATSTFSFWKVHSVVLVYGKAFNHWTNVFEEICPASVFFFVTSRFRNSLEIIWILVVGQQTLLNSL